MVVRCNIRKRKSLSTSLVEVDLDQFIVYNSDYCRVYDLSNAEAGKLARFHRHVNLLTPSLEEALGKAVGQALGPALGVALGPGHRGCLVRKFFLLLSCFSEPHR